MLKPESWVEPTSQSPLSRLTDRNIYHKNPWFQKELWLNSSVWCPWSWWVASSVFLRMHLSNLCNYRPDIVILARWALARRRRGSLKAREGSDGPKCKIDGNDIRFHWCSSLCKLCPKMDSLARLLAPICEAIAHGGSPRPSPLPLIQSQPHCSLFICLFIYFRRMQAILIRAEVELSSWWNGD